MGSKHPRRSRPPVGGQPAGPQATNHVRGSALAAAGAVDPGRAGADQRAVLQRGDPAGHSHLPVRRMQQLSAEKGEEHSGIPRMG